MTREGKALLRNFLTRAAMVDNSYLADALRMEPQELRYTAQAIIKEIKKPERNTGKELGR